MINFNEEIEKIKEQIIKNYQPEKIILFGSCANGTQKEYSDVDLFIIKNSEKRFIERVHELLCMLEYDVPLDVVVYNPKEYSNALNSSNGLVQEVLKKGVVLYERTAG